MPVHGGGAYSVGTKLILDMEYVCSGRHYVVTLDSGEVVPRETRKSDKFRVQYLLCGVTGIDNRGSLYVSLR